MPFDNAPKPVKGQYQSLASQYARAKALKEAEDAAKQRENLANSIGAMDEAGQAKMVAVEKVNASRAAAFKRAWNKTAAFFLALFFVHAAGIYFFTRGFLLSRLVLESKSSCTEPPIELTPSFRGSGTVEKGCWHPKTFDKAVVLIIDALRYDFTVPQQNSSEYYHGSLPFLYETAVKEPQNAFLRPFIADPPTTTLQRLKGLTTGTLPTFIDAGSNFAGTAIDEDNLLMQLRHAGKRMVHLGDDTWLSLFPGYFEEEYSRAYDSFNVHDLHTVDNGVIEHIIPLLKKDRRNDWDVIFGHFLGVDHAGHRYGPDHPAMQAKLQQMDKVLRDIVATIDDSTLLVVMGDHGMDSKGDHGGESDDEIEAALWMYSRKGIFGRTSPEFVTPPANAKTRPVNQIDLVPTLSLLLGLPIPFNNLGRPIEEAFAGKKGNAWDNLSHVARMTAAGIRRYQSAYYQARGVEEGSGAAKLATTFWDQGLTAASAKDWKRSYADFLAYQFETLQICRGLWARFDVPSMILGISLLAVGLIVLLQYNTNNSDSDAVQHPELDRAEQALEIQNAKDGQNVMAQKSLVPAMVTGVIGAVAGFAGHVTYRGEDATLLDNGLCGLAIGILAALSVHVATRDFVRPSLPNDIWGWLAIIFTISQSVGFGSNSYTIWEDSILLFFLTTFGFISAVSSVRKKHVAERALGIYHSALFVALGWIASFSKLCREEQAEYCFSSYYSSSNSSTSALWQVAIPYVLALFLPSVIKSFYQGTRSYSGFAPVWIDWALRIGLVCNAVFWTMDAADDGSWIPDLPGDLLKNSRVIIARTVFAMALVAGMIGFGWATPCITITSAPVAPSEKAQAGGPRIVVLGYANAHGTRYFLLVLNILLAVLLIQKPMGAGSIGLMAWQTLSLLEIIDTNSLSDSAIGPVMLGILGSFHFFKTGHQATLSAIQWESAFVPLHTIKYPWSPLLVVLNSFGAQILATAAVPLVALWKKEPREKGLLQKVARVVGIYILYFAVINLTTTVFAGWLRRHLMLYRIFSPRFMTGAAVLLVVDAAAVLVALTGVRVNTLSVREIFGWPSA